MNVRIFWVCAMKCMCAQTRPRFILSFERVFWGNGVWTHVYSKGKIPSTGKFPQRRLEPATLWTVSLNTTNELFRSPHNKWSLSRSQKLFDGSWLCTMQLSYLHTVPSPPSICSGNPCSSPSPVLCESNKLISDCCWKIGLHSTASLVVVFGTCKDMHVYTWLLTSWCQYRLVGLVVRCPPRKPKIPGSNPTCTGMFSGSSHTSDSKIGTPVATLPGAWHYKVSTGTGRPGVSILWLGEIEQLICNFYLSVAARKIVWADLSLRYTSLLLGR